MIAPDRAADAAILLAEVRQLRAELAEVREELAVARVTGDRALARAEDIGGALAYAGEVAGVPIVTRRPSSPLSLIQGGAS